MAKPSLEGFFDRATTFFNSATPEVERRIRQMIQSALSRMDLVTRDEFDAQTKVLQHTRQRLEELERKLAEMEAEEQQN